MLLTSVRENQEICVGIKDLRWNSEQRTLNVKNRTIPLTATEYQLLFPLREGVPVTYAELVSIVYKCMMDDKVRIVLDKHIDRIRGKLRGTGIYVYCVLGYGYMLLPEIWAS